MSLFDVLFVGGGPAGTGPLICALQSGRADWVTGRRMGLLDGSSRLCVGAMDRYVIRSNSYATSFIECAEGDRAEAWLHKLQDEPSYLALDAARYQVVPLPVVARFLRQLGRGLESRLTEIPTFALGFRTIVDSARWREGVWEVRLRGHSDPVRTRALVLATGGRPRRLAGMEEAEEARNIFRPGWRPQAKHYRIVGSSHSAWAAAARVLRLGRGMVTVSIRGRSSPKPFFDTPQAALNAGFTDFTDDDVCPLTGRLFRLGGLRGDALALFRNGHRNLHHETVDEPASDRPPSGAVIVNALGFEPSLPPIEWEGRPLTTRVGAVDADCQIVDATGDPIPGLFGMGLGLGYRLPGSMGGEKSFSGQTNGLWLYQNDVGSRLLDAVDSHLNHSNN